MRYSEPHLLLAYTVLRRLYVLCRPNAVTFVCTLSTKQISRCSLFYKLRKLGRVLCVWLTCNIVVLTFFLFSNEVAGLTLLARFESHIFPLKLPCGLLHVTHFLSVRRYSSSSAYFPPAPHGYKEWMTDRRIHPANSAMEQTRPCPQIDAKSERSCHPAWRRGKQIIVIIFIFVRFIDSSQA